MKYLLDSSVYISMTVADDVHHEQSVAFARSIVTEHLVTPTLVIAEVLTIISKLKPSELSHAYRYLRKNEIVELDLNFIRKFFKKVTIDNHLKASDRVIAVTAATCQATLVTWDKQMLAHAGSLCSVMSPATKLKKM